MRPSRRDQLWKWIVLCTAAGAAARSGAQQRAPAVEEPRLLRFQLREVSTGVYSEGSFENASYGDGSTTASSRHIFVGPLLGLNFDGSVYHPNLMTYQFLSEGALGWMSDRSESGQASSSLNEFSYLGNINASANFLANKPYNAGLFATYNHSYRDNDFFTRLIVDQWRYGGQANYQKEAFGVSGYYTRRDENTSGYGGLTQTHDNTAGINARSDRRTGGTTLNYTYNDYSRVDYDVPSGGVNNSVALADNERFGSLEQTRLNSRASYTRNEFEAAPNEEFATEAVLSTEHRENLSSLYQVSYDHYTTDDYTSSGIFGQAQLQHQLYESLQSTVTILGADNDTSGRFSTGYNRYYGGGYGFAYTKQLSSSSRLRIDNSFVLEHVDQKSIGIAENERHSFIGSGTPDSFFLNLPYVDEATIMVWNVGRTRLYIRGIDYTVFRNGALTGIRRVTGSDIDNIVVADYRAAPSPAGSYESFSDHLGVRFELFDNLWGVYGRAQWFLNNAPPDLLVQDITSYTFGTDVTWRWLRAGAEYEIYDSTFSSYRATRLFEGATFALDDASSFGLDFTQSWTDYINSDDSLEEYRFIARYHRNFSSRLVVNVDAGVDFQRGMGPDRTLAVFRPALRYQVGRTTINAEYNLEYSGYLDIQHQQRHLFLLSIKRVF